MDWCGGVELKILGIDIETAPNLATVWVKYRNLPITYECIDHNQRGNKQGYGHSGNDRLHRKVFKYYFGFLPEVVRHNCDNPRCINPMHLLPGTAKDNVRDMISRGRRGKKREDKRKLTFILAEEIREERKKGRTYADLSVQYGVSPSNILELCKGRTYTA